MTNKNQYQGNPAQDGINAARADARVEARCRPIRSLADDLVRKLEWLSAVTPELAAYKRSEIAECLKLAQWLREEMK